MGKKISFTVTVDDTIHQKLALVALLNGQSMTELLTDWVQEMDVRVPDELLSGKGQVEKQWPAPVKPGKSGNPVDDDIKAMILKKRSEKVTMREISEKLNQDNIPTPSGNGKWHASTISTLIQKWKYQEVRE